MESLSVRSGMQHDILCPEKECDRFSRIEIDTELSRLDADEKLLLKFVYKRIAYSPKMSFFDGKDGKPQFALKNLDFSEPNIENVIVGECQSGKSAEIVWVAWCCWFILGCLPVIYVRNSGGKTQGSPDMIDSIKDMNGRVNEVLLDAKKELPDLDAKIDRLVRNGRFILNVVTEEREIKADGKLFDSAKVLVTLMNPAHLRKMMGPFHQRGSKWILGTITEICGSTYTINYCDTEEFEHLEKIELRTETGKKFPPNHSPRIGETVKAQQSPGLRLKEGILNAMTNYGTKSGKRRVIFIMDEADLCVGNPDRNKNQSEKELYHNKERLKFEGINHSGLTNLYKGAIRNIYGSVFVTATPQALFICAPERAQKLGAHQKGDEHQAGDRIELNDDDEEFGSDEERLSSAVTAQTHPRGLKPHIVYVERPDNYISYQTSNWPDNGRFIKREILPSRYEKIKTKWQIYKQEWLREHGPDGEVEWKNMEKSLREGVDRIVLWDGFFLKLDKKAGLILIQSPDRRKNTPEQAKRLEDIDNKFRAAKESQRGQTAWEIDGGAIKYMLADMICSVDEYRHALIISDKTKLTKNQRDMQEGILRAFSGSKDLAVAVYNCTEGISIKFTEHTLLRFGGGLLEAAAEAIRKVVRKERSVVTIEDRSIKIKDEPIGVMYEGLKTICSRIVVITGELGGRGVSYHDLQHERILTDMYTGQDVFDDAPVRSHGEMLIQILGRLNTIFKRDMRVPTVRLWATECVHDLHKVVLEEVRHVCDAVMTKHDYVSALRSRPWWTTGTSKCGRKHYTLPMTRSAFNKADEAMRGSTPTRAAITIKRHRGTPPEVDMSRSFPEGSRCKCVERRPHGADTSDVRDVLGKWVPTSGMPWDSTKHSLWEVEIPLALVAEDKIREFCKSNERVMAPNKAQPWRFYTLRAARNFISSGAAGANEAKLMQARHPNLADISVESEADEGSAMGYSIELRDEESASLDKSDCGDDHRAGRRVRQRTNRFTPSEGGRGLQRDGLDHLMAGRACVADKDSASHDRSKSDCQEIVPTRQMSAVGYRIRQRTDRYMPPGTSNAPALAITRSSGRVLPIENQSTMASRSRIARR